MTSSTRPKATGDLRLRECTNLAMSPADLRALEREWVEAVVPELLRGLSLAELVHAADSGLGLSKRVGEDLSDLMRAQDAVRRGPAGGYDELLDRFGDSRRNAIPPDGVVRRWHADYGGFLSEPTAGAQLLLLPIGIGEWAACDGSRLWRIMGNPFAL